MPTVTVWRALGFWGRRSRKRSSRMDDEEDGEGTAVVLPGRAALEARAPGSPEEEPSGGVG